MFSNTTKFVLVVSTLLIMSYAYVWNKATDEGAKGAQSLIKQRDYYKEAMWRYKTLFEAKDAEYYILSLKYKKQLMIQTYGK